MKQIMLKKGEITMAAKKNETVSENIGVEVPKLNLGTFTLKLIGDSPLIVHAWSTKAKEMMLNKQMKKASAGREAKDPFADFCDSLYWLSERPENLTTMEQVRQGRFGFPVVAFKSAAIDGAYQAGALAKKTTARGAFHILGEMAEIHGTLDMREDMCRVGMGVADIRYRGEFTDWWTELTVQYNRNAMSIEQIINLFNIGGFGVGVGEWRPAKDGSYGRFHVAMDGE